MMLLGMRWSDNRISGWVWLFVFCCCFMSRPAPAQVLFGEIVGNVTDSSGALVPGANVRATDILTNLSRTVSSGSGGTYTAADLPAGTYTVSITKAGFKDFTARNVVVRANTVVRLDAQLEVGAQSQRVVVNAGVVELQTDRADVHTEIEPLEVENLPEATYNYQSLMALVPGMAALTGSQLSGGTNNPSKSMQIQANGTGLVGTNIRVDGVSTVSPWQEWQSTFVPATDDIASVNVVTSSPAAEQGLAGGASISVLLKSGTNEMHGSFFEYNVTNATEAKNYFQTPSESVPHLVDNDLGGTLGGHIIRNKLFYFGSYEGDFTRQGYFGIGSVPTPTMLSGNETGSPTPIYDPATGDPTTGAGKTQFDYNGIPNMIDPARIASAIKLMIPNIPPPNLPGIQNNYAVTQAYMYNLHKIDAKIDYDVTSKLRVSGHWGYQPYLAGFGTLFGILGGADSDWNAFYSNGNGVYSQHGATLLAEGSAVYVFSPKFVIDANFGITQAHQLLLPNLANQRYCLDVLGIPGSNQGNFPEAGGNCAFDLYDYEGEWNLSPDPVTFGPSYPGLQYRDPVWEYVANATRLFGSHTVRFGLDFTNVIMNHDEVSPTFLVFTGGLTSLPGGAATNPYNVVADFLLGLPQNMSDSVQNVADMYMSSWEFGLYGGDQWQVARKLTLSYGLRWEYYPVPGGLALYDLLNSTPTPYAELCGVAGNSPSCGATTQKDLFVPSVGIAYRLQNNTVVRAGFAISPYQNEMAVHLDEVYPRETDWSSYGATSYVAGGSTATGFPINVPPCQTCATDLIPPGTGNLETIPKKFIRGYAESYNLTLQRDLGHNFSAQVGYVGTHSLKLYGELNINYGTIGGGTASQPFNQFGLDGSVPVTGPTGSDYYDALQAQLTRHFTNGLAVQVAYTRQHDISFQYTTLNPIPAYYYLNKGNSGSDRPNNLSISSTAELPFGKGKPWAQHGVQAAVAGGWSLTGLYFHLSGAPFTVTDSANASCNCPGVTVTADQVLPSISKVGNGLNGNPYFNPLAFAPVTSVSPGDVRYDNLRGPGNSDLDLSLFRTFKIYEGLNMQLRFESFNITNTPAFANPGSDVSAVSYNPDGSIAALNGFSQISATAGVARVIQPRYLRGGVHFTF